jgi:hypothetical protein
MSVTVLQPRALRRRLGRDRTWRRWTVAWLGGAALGIANGIGREAVYTDRVGDPTANQISAATLTLLLAAYFWELDRRWPIPTAREARAIGATWAALTVGFEFLFGHYVDGDSWSELLDNYDVTGGHLWILVLAWIGVGPSVIRALRRSREGGNEGGTS